MTTIIFGKKTDRSKIITTVLLLKTTYSDVSTYKLCILNKNKKRKIISKFKILFFKLIEFLNLKKWTLEQTLILIIVQVILAQHFTDSKI